MFYSDNLSHELRVHISSSLALIICSTQDEYSDESDQDKPQLKAVVCMGRQPGSNVFVLGPRLQFYSNGDSIPTDQQHYVWVDYLLNSSRFTTRSIQSMNYL